MRRTGRRCLAATMLLGLSISACSGSDQSEPHLSASQVCASTLDQTAAAALENMGDTKEFEEAFTEGPERFSLDHATQALHPDGTPRNSCYVTTADTENHHPLIDVSFSATGSHPKPGPSQKSEPGTKLYPIGLYADTSKVRSATIYFKCPTQDGENTTPYVAATLYSASDEISPRATPQDLMTVLTSMSRALAEHIGCASEANLPQRV